MLGGRAAEEMVFHDPTTGAGNDIEKATCAGPRDGHPVRHDRAARRDQARREQLRAVPGPRHGPPAQLLRGRRRDRRRGDQEAARRPPTRRPSTSWRRTATCSTRWSLALLEKETLDKAQIAEVFEPLRRRPARPAWTGSPGPRALDASRRSRCPRRSAPGAANGAAAAEEPRARVDPHAARQRRRRARRRHPGGGAPQPAAPSAMTDPIELAGARGRRHPGVRPRRAPRPPSASC